MILPESQWTARRAAHEAAVDALLRPHQLRSARGETHPVLDFLFTYYNHRPGRLRRWHPGLGVTLAGARSAEYLNLAGYTAGADGVAVSGAMVCRRTGTVDFVRSLLQATATRPAQLGCFGLHEWAMVYQGGPEALRHDDVGLRLGHQGTDAVVQDMQLRCTHHDAFRFFTPQAQPRNAVQTTRADQRRLEQPGCLHANMDLYKWAYKLEPLVPSELLLRCLLLAIDARELDMRASPYDLAGYGYEPVPIETAAGRAQYVREQTALAHRAVPLRRELLAVCERAARPARPHRPSAAAQ